MTRLSTPLWWLSAEATVGISVAKALDEHATVTLVEPKDAFVHNIAALRSVVQTDFLPRMFLPYDRLLAHGEVLRDRAVRVDGHTVELAAGAGRARAAVTDQPGWLLNGVTMLDPRQTFIDVTVQLGRERHDLPGHDPAGRHRRRQRLRDRSVDPARRLPGVGAGVRMQYSVGEEATIPDGTVVGPFAHITRESLLS